MQKYEIVCIDDETELLSLYEIELESLGHKVVTFSNPEEALSYVKENHTKIAFVVSDYKMPEMNGLEFRRRMVEEDLMTPFAMITGFYSKEMAVEGMELRVLRFVQKPFDSSEVIELIKTEGGKYIQNLEEEYEMIRSFVEESSPMIEEIEELILVLEEEPGNINALNTYFRLLHTIKGTASCVGLNTLPDFTHKYEDLVTLLKDGKLPVTNAIIDILLKGLDVLKTMYQDIQDGIRYEFDIEESIKIFDLENIDKVEAKEAEKSETSEVETVIKKKEDEKIAVQVGILDEFMELSGEITVLRNMILKSVSKIEQRYSGDRDIDVLSDTLDEMHKVSSKLQNEISEMRKVSVDTVYRPLKRVVRDASKKLGKQIDVDFSGEKYRVDTSIGRVLNNVLVHLIRNGIDHGLETPEVRESKGKDPVGKLAVSTEIDAENIIIEISDDGNGMDRAKLIDKALEKELYTEEALSKMSDQRIFSLIFESGFSTAAEVTDISGRGVGMDMVRSSVEDVGGKILIDSTLGQGTRFVLVLPIPRSVLIIKSLMVEAGSQQIAVPLHDIGEVINLDGEKVRQNIRMLNDALILNHHDELIPLIDLGSEFKQSTEGDLYSKNVVVIRGDGFCYGLIVDHVFDIEEVVVKKMAKQLQHSKSIFQGATLIGDGEMALILDLENLAMSCEIEINETEDEDFFSNEEASSSEGVDEYLQFSLRSRDGLAIKLSSIDRLEEVRRDAINYTGNIPVIRYRGDFLPIVDLDYCLDFSKDVDLESNEIFKVLVIGNGEYQVGFVVKEINDISISDESIDTLIRDREGLLGTTYISGKTINVIDEKYIISNYKQFYNNQVQEDIELPLAA
jgi:two-component system chemotaxis sensor kinase CheA